MRTLLLVRHAPTAATREFAFPGDEPLDDAGLRAAGTLRVPRGYGVAVSPSLRCRQTAEAAGLTVAEVVADVAECDFGTWTGRTAADVDLGAWMTDAGAAPHGGESLTTFAARVAAWLDTQATRDGATTVITHGGVIKACVVRALRAPLEAFWQVDVAPLSLTELHAHDGRWTVKRVNAPGVSISSREDRSNRHAGGEQ